MSRVLEKEQLEALFVTARSKGVSVGFKILVISVAQQEQCLSLSHSTHKRNTHTQIYKPLLYLHVHFSNNLLIHSVINSYQAYKNFSLHNNSGSTINTTIFISDELGTLISVTFPVMDKIGTNISYIRLNYELRFYKPL